MKLKKLLAAVTAAALAVTTMAVTSFTASATSLSEAPVGTETVLYSVDLSSVKSTFTSSWDSGDWTQIIIDENDRATIMTDPDVYIKATMSNMGSVTTDKGDVDFDTLMTWGFGGYNWMTGLKWYNNSNDGANFECNLLPLETSTANRAIAYAPISDAKMYDWGGIAGNLQCGHFSKLTLDKLEIVRVSAVVDTTVYADQVLPLPAFEGSTLKFDGTFDKTKINGLGAYIEIKWTANDASSGMKLMKAEDYDTVIGQKNGNGSIGAQTTTFKLDETFISKMTDKMWVNGWGVASIESVTIHNDATKGDVYTVGGTTPPTPTYTLTPATATIKTGLSNGQVFTLEGYTAEEQIVWDIDSDYAAKYVGSANGLENNQCKIVGTAAGGPVTLTAKSPDGDVLGTATITFTDSTTTDPATVNLEFPTTPIEIPVYQSESNILASVEIPFTIDGNKTYEDVKDTTYIINGINFTSIAKDGKELDLKKDLICISMPGDGKVTTLKKGDKNKSITIDMSTIVNDENKTAKFEKVVLILSFGSVKDSGLAVGDKIVLNDGTTPPDPGHTHTPAATWTSDATGHWHACSDCDEKLDFAAHTSDGGKVTIPATETTTGVKTYKCTECGYVIKTETIPAIGITPSPSDPSHNYTGGAVVPIINNGSNSRNPSISGDNGKSGWDAIVSEIAGSGDGSKVSVDMNSATKVPSSIMKEIEGLDIDLVLNMGRGIKWTINGLSVTGHKNIDFGVSKNTRHIPNDVVSTVEGTYKKQISLDHNGNFGCTAALTVDVGTKYNGLYANLFYYNPKTESLELTDCSLISGGNAKFMFTHASDYLITVTAEPLGEFEDVSSAAGIASDNNSIGNGIALSAVLTAIVLGFGIVVYKKRRHN